MTDSINRREFLKKWALASWSILLAWFFGKKIYDSFMEESEFGKDDIKENARELPVYSLKDKPIDLWYHQYVEDKKLILKNMPGNKFNTISRVSRCLRWKPITDAVEDRYGIPRWLLMGMMAQEWMWDPTMPNMPPKDYKYGDVWLGLIHIQAVNAHDFGLKTLPRSTNKMVDRVHWKLIDEALSSCNKDISKLVKLDDRFHPVLAVDCSARFLMNCKRRVWNGTDSWMHALKKYSARSYSDYCVKVIKYWTAVNNVTWDGFPEWFSQDVNTLMSNKTKDTKYVVDNLNKLSFVIDGEESGYDEYLAFFEQSMQNFYLGEYMEMWTYQESLEKYKTKLEEKDKTFLLPKEKKETPINTLIQSEFVDTKRHNSQWYRLFRYKVLQWDSPLWISDKFDTWDKQKGDKYVNTWDLNVVRYDGKTANNLKPGEVIYVKVRNR